MPEFSSTSSDSIAPLTLPADRQLVLRVMPMPADANGNGDIFGGWIMAQVDLAGAVPAMRVAKGRVATVAVNSFVFKQPVFVGDIVSFYTQLVRVGHTSVTIRVTVEAERWGVPPTRMGVAGHGEVVKVTEAEVILVAVNDQGRPIPVRPEPLAHQPPTTNHQP